MTAPREFDVATDDVTLRVLEWGDPSSPVALCLHGFPDSAHGWRKVAPLLVDAGYRVVAPFMRGYAPSSVSAERSYQIGALMDDALRVLDAAGPTGRDVLIGHDWGAITAAGLVAMPDATFAHAVVMSVPPLAAFRGRVQNPGRLLATLPMQMARSWYIAYNQLPWLPDHSASWLIPRLWQQWSPGYAAHEDVVLVRAAIGEPANWRAALGYYRQNMRFATPPPRYADLNRYWLSKPAMPVLYLHGTDDGCMTADYTRWAEGVLPDGSRTELVDNAGHFLQLEQPEVVARHILDFVGSPT